MVLKSIQLELAEQLALLQEAAGKLLLVDAKTETSGKPQQVQYHGSAVAEQDLLQRASSAAADVLATARQVQGPGLLFLSFLPPSLLACGFSCSACLNSSKNTATHPLGPFLSGLYACGRRSKAKWCGYGDAGWRAGVHYDGGIFSAAGQVTRGGEGSVRYKRVGKQGA